jgi:tetratricopeptide (TPR) repeat protein
MRGRFPMAVGPKTRGSVALGSRALRSLALAAMLCGSGLILGCVELSYVGKAEMAYDDGRYFEAAELLAAREEDMRDLPVFKRARYGVYRGLSLLRLGEYESAEEWLRYAHELDAEHHTLAPRQRERLAAGLAELARTRAGATPRAGEVRER